MNNEMIRDLRRKMEIQPGRKSRTLAEAKREGTPAARGRLLRINDVIATTGLSRATIYRLVQAGTFPRSLPLTARAVGWWESDVEKWLDSRVPAA